jgi:hypothetical protein
MLVRFALRSPEDVIERRTNYKRDAHDDAGSFAYVP